MNTSYSEQRKIGGCGRFKPDGTRNDNDRVEIGPTTLAFNEWADAGLEVPQLARMREFRLNRLVEQINQRNLAGVLLFDPLNIRYASDTTNMQLWAMHNMFRACFVAASGYMILWDYKPNDLLTGFNPLVKETRSGAGFYFFASGDQCERDADQFAAQLCEVISEHCSGNNRLAVDKIMIEGLRALEAHGVQVLPGEELMEKSRAIKGPDEIAAMRCSVYACEQAVRAMHYIAAPGLAENEIWAVLHAENIRRGGEWIETRLLSSGPRTNPWFQECGPRIVQNNELLAFDTDLIGCYGMCCDISRTWFIGDGEPTPEQRRLFRHAYDQIVHNQACLAPGRYLADVVADFKPLPGEFSERRYSCAMHGVGLCDEWPLVKYQNDYKADEFNLILEPGMTFCVEAYIGALGGWEGVKLEEQVLITETGVERLSVYPFEACLLA